MAEFKPRQITPYDLAICPSNHEAIAVEGIYHTRSGLLYVCRLADEVGLGVVLENRKVATANEQLAELKGFVFEKRRPDELADYCEYLASLVVEDRENLRPVRLLQDVYWEAGLLTRAGSETTKKDRVVAALGRMGRDEAPLANQSYADPSLRGSSFAK